MQKLLFQALQRSFFKTSEYVEDETPKGDKRWKSFNFNWWLIDFAHGVSVHQCLSLRDSPLMVKNDSIQVIELILSWHCQMNKQNP